jgi:hypothetical protein
LFLYGHGCSFEQHPAGWTHWQSGTAKHAPITGATR